MPIEEIKKLRDISRDVLFLLIYYTRYHFPIEALEFYYENNIKIIWLATVFSRLKSNRKFLCYYEEIDCIKTFTTINSKKINNIKYRNHKWVFMMVMIVLRHMDGWQIISFIFILLKYYLTFLNSIKKLNYKRQ